MENQVRIRHGSPFSVVVNYNKDQAVALTYVAAPYCCEYVSKLLFINPKIPNQLYISMHGRGKHLNKICISSSFYLVIFTHVEEEEEENLISATTFIKNLGHRSFGT